MGAALVFSVIIPSEETGPAVLYWLTLKPIDRRGLLHEVESKPIGRFQRERNSITAAANEIIYAIEPAANGQAADEITQCPERTIRSVEVDLASATIIIQRAEIYRVRIA